MSLNRNKFLDESEELTLKKTLKLYSRNDVIVLLALETGLRASELLNIQASDLFDDTSSILVRTLKGGTDRELPLRKDLYEAVKRFIPFGISYQRLDQIWANYKPYKKKFHALRHTFAVNLYKRTKDIKLVQLALGHRSPTTTSIYTDFVYNLDEMRRIIA